MLYDFVMEDITMEKIFSALGSRVYCLIGKTKEVKEGILVGVNIGASGYELVAILVNAGEKKKKVNIESAHVWWTEKDAEEHKAKVCPIIDLGEEEANKANEKIDELRVKVIGVPPFLKLAKEIMN
jgi:hypothetical protein